MIQELPNISGKIDSFSLEVLNIVSEVSSTLNIEMFVIGASALDIIFKQIYDINIHRVTNDIDFSVRVKSWDDYSKLVDNLLASGFSSSKIIHRFNYKSIPSIDLIPFGEISLSTASIEWPDDASKSMSVLGFEECFKDSMLVRIQESPDFDVNVASPRSLVILKFISWQDGFPTRSRDAQDILYIMQNYIEAGNFDRISEQHSDLLNDSFDFELTGPILLGMDIAEIASPETLAHLISVVSSQIEKASDSEFITDMMRGIIVTDDYDRSLDHHITLLQNLLEGLNK